MTLVAHEPSYDLTTVIHADTNWTRTTTISPPLPWECRWDCRCRGCQWSSTAALSTGDESWIDPWSLNTDTETERHGAVACTYEGNCSSNAVKQLKSMMIATQPAWDYWRRSQKGCFPHLCGVLTHPFGCFWLLRVSPTAFLFPVPVAGCSWFTRWQITLWQLESLHRPNIAV